VPASIAARYRQAPILLGARDALQLAGASAPVDSARSRPLGRCATRQLAARVERMPAGRRQTDRLGDLLRETAETRNGSTVRPPSEASLLADDTSSGRVGTPATRSCRSRVPQSSRPCDTLHAGRRDAATRHARDQPSRSNDRPPVKGTPSGAPAQGTHARTDALRGASGRARQRDLSRSWWTLNARLPRFGAVIVTRNSDATLRDSRGLRAGVVAGAGTQEWVLDLWEPLAPFGGRARQAAESAAACASELYGRVRRPMGHRQPGPR
jgi:hypothetical protein